MNDPAQSQAYWPEPMLTDIAFQGADMILSMRDRHGDQLGNAAGDLSGTNTRRMTEPLLVICYGRAW